MGTHAAAHVNERKYHSVNTIKESRNRSPQRAPSTASPADTPANENVRPNINATKMRRRPPQRMTSATSSADTLASQEDDSDEDHVQYEILLWHGSSLGNVEFTSCDATGYPCVQVANGNNSLPGMWNLRESDFLIAVNECSTKRSAMSFESVMRVVENGVRPAVLRFRRPASHEFQRVPMRKRQSTQEARQVCRRNRERLEQTMSYVIWREEDGPLGVSLKKAKGSSHPVVAAMNRTSVLNRQAPTNKVSIGDHLLSINQHDVHELGGKQWVRLLGTAPKPLVLTFRRSAPPPHQVGARTLDL
ncbi:hypothetical protein BBJ28_00020707 [Nothophytophthora sp. Chile5]|nr:hypothetical protein BBJ28_00020707 [Nothophytophthora sp. Chile5]